MKLIANILVITILLFSSLASGKLPAGAEIIMKAGSNVTYDKETGMFKDANGKPVLPQPDSYQVVVPGQNTQTNAPAPTPATAAPSNANTNSGGSKSRGISAVADTDNGGVSNYSPKGASSVSSSSASPANPIYDRAKTDNIEAAPLIPRTQQRVNITTSSREELTEFQNVISDAIKKARELQDGIKKNKITAADYTKKSEHEIKPSIVRLKSKLMARKKSVINNSYYVRIIEEQIKICDRLVDSLDIGRRYITSHHEADLKAYSLQLETTEKSVPMIAVKYHVMDTQ